MINPDGMELCEKASALLSENLAMLRDATPTDKIDEYLRDWAIVLGVLARNVLDSTCILLKAGQLRTANMLSRALADYAVRLRYYIVQAMAVRQKHVGEQPDAFITEIDAAADFENASYKLGKLLRIYDPGTWPPEAREKLEKIIASTDKELNRSFTVMVRYLADNEVQTRHLISKYIRDAEYRYGNIRANWRMQSGFLHGDQMIITDVIDHDGDGNRTGKINEKGDGDARIIIFTALLEAMNLLESLALIHGDASEQLALDRNIAHSFLGQWH